MSERGEAPFKLSLDLYTYSTTSLFLCLFRHRITSEMVVVEWGDTADGAVGSPSQVAPALASVLQFNDIAITVFNPSVFLENKLS